MTNDITNAELAEEMRAGFKDIRGEMQAGFKDVREEMRTGFKQAKEDRLHIVEMLSSTTRILRQMQETKHDELASRVGNLESKVAELVA